MATNRFMDPKEGSEVAGSTVATDSGKPGFVFDDMDAEQAHPDSSDNFLMPVARTLFRTTVLVIVILSGASVFTGIWIPVVSDVGKLLGKYVFTLVDGSASRLGLVMVIFILTHFLFRRSKSSQ